MGTGTSEDVCYLLAIRGATRGEGKRGIEPGSSDPKSSPLPLCHRGGRDRLDLNDNVFSVLYFFIKAAKRILTKLDSQEVFQFLYRVCAFEPIDEQRWPTWSLIGWHFSSSATDEWISPNLDRKQLLSIQLQLPLHFRILSLYSVFLEKLFIAFKIFDRLQPKQKGYRPLFLHYFNRFNCLRLINVQHVSVTKHLIWFIWCDKRFPDLHC